MAGVTVGQEEGCVPLAVWICAQTLHVLRVCGAARVQVQRRTALPRARIEHARHPLVGGGSEHDVAAVHVVGAGEDRGPALALHGKVSGERASGDVVLRDGIVDARHQQARVVGGEGEQDVGCGGDDGEGWAGARQAQVPQLHRAVEGGGGGEVGRGVGEAHDVDVLFVHGGQRAHFAARGGVEEVDVLAVP